MFLYRPPKHPKLEPFVDALWLQQGAPSHHFECLLPSANVQLLINLADDLLSDFRVGGCEANTIGGIGIQGVRTTPIVVATSQQQAVCGVSIKPASTRLFMGVPAFELTDRLSDLSTLLDVSNTHLRERLLAEANAEQKLDLIEEFLLGCLRDTAPPSERIQQACGLLTKGYKVGDVCQHVELTPKRFIRLFRHEVGVRPKLFARLTRFQQLVKDLDSKRSLVELALSHGFSDQAHMTREFKIFAGMTPTTYSPYSTNAPLHVKVPNDNFVQDTADVSF